MQKDNNSKIQAFKHPQNQKHPQNKLKHLKTRALKDYKIQQLKNICIKTHTRGKQHNKHQHTQNSNAKYPTNQDLKRSETQLFKKKKKKALKHARTQNIEIPQSQKLNISKRANKKT